MNLILVVFHVALIPIIWVALGYVLSDPVDRKKGINHYLTQAWQWVITFRCPRCTERKSYKVREDWWGHVMCSPCLVEYKRQLVREEKQRLLDEAIEIERRRIAARDYVQAEREKKGYRG